MKRHIVLKIYFFMSFSNDAQHSNDVVSFSISKVSTYTEPKFRPSFTRSSSYDKHTFFYDKGIVSTYVEILQVTIRNI